LYWSHARGAGTSAARGDPAISRAQDGSHAGQLRGRVKWPGPPDTAGQEHNGVGAADHLPPGRQDPHLEQEFVRRQAEKLLHPGSLQWGHSVPARFEHPAESPGQRGAKRTVSIEEDPSGKRPASFTVSQF